MRQSFNSGLLDFPPNPASGTHLFLPWFQLHSILHWFIQNFIYWLPSDPAIQSNLINFKLPVQFEIWIKWIDCRPEEKFKNAPLAGWNSSESNSDRNQLSLQQVGLTRIEWNSVEWIQLHFINCLNPTRQHKPKLSDSSIQSIWNQPPIKLNWNPMKPRNWLQWLKFEFDGWFHFQFDCCWLMN